MVRILVTLAHDSIVTYYFISTEFCKSLSYGSSLKYLADSNYRRLENFQ